MHYVLNKMCKLKCHCPNTYGHNCTSGHLQNFMWNLWQKLPQLRQRGPQEPLDHWSSLQHKLTNQRVDTWELTQMHFLLQRK